MFFLGSELIAVKYPHLPLSKAWTIVSGPRQRRVTEYGCLSLRVDVLRKGRRRVND